MQTPQTGGLGSEFTGSYKAAAHEHIKKGMFVTENKKKTIVAKYNEIEKFMLRFWRVGETRQKRI